jgi:hypothetical protein
MGRSFVSFKEDSFVVWDGILEGLLYTLTREFRKLDNQSDWTQTVINEWISASTIGYSGCVPTSLDELFDTQAKVKILKDTLAKVKTGFRTNPNFLTADELNENGIGGDAKWTTVNTPYLLRATQLLIDLLDGKFKDKHIIDYWDNLEID